MSEDRMDRAERIRNMREGNRGTDDESADTESATDDATATTASVADSEPATDREPDPEPTTGSTATTEATPAAETQPTTEPDPEPTTETTPMTEPQATETTPAQSETQATDSDDDAEAAAQRAAQAAADVTESGTATGSGGTPGGIAQAPAGIELPDQQLLEEAMASSTTTSTEGGARAAIEGQSSSSEELVRVLEFSLGDEYYCLDIEYVEEIVKRDAVTRVPNTPDFVDGVVDLRGQITTILEPKEMMDIDAEGDQDLIIVFDPAQFEEQGAVGWVVDEVRQVVPVTESEVNSPPVDAEYINGVIDREEYDQFVIWIEPDDALAQATSGDGE